MFCSNTLRSTLIVRPLLGRAGEDTRSSTQHPPRPYLTYSVAYCNSWIQGHPEFGFNFKALVCHDGVFDATYNGYSTDELFFVRSAFLIPDVLECSPCVVQS